MNKWNQQSPEFKALGQTLFCCIVPYFHWRGLEIDCMRHAPGLELRLTEQIPFFKSLSQVHKRDTWPVKNAFSTCAFTKPVYIQGSLFSPFPSAAPLNKSTFPWLCSVAETESTSQILWVCTYQCRACASGRAEPGAPQTCLSLQDINGSICGHCVSISGLDIISAIN